jgi:hypothetical protein
MSNEQIDVNVGCAIASIEVAKRDLLDIYAGNYPRMLSDDLRGQWCRDLIAAQLALTDALRRIETLFSFLKQTGGPVR